jgi:two-component system OmpR family response regulator
MNLTRHQRILLIEDDAVLADGLARSLQQTGYVVDHERDGLAADQLLTSTQCDLVILDLCLPRMDGFEVLRRLRERGSKVPVLMLTALDDLSERVRGLDLGADDYLAKPFDLPELEARVRALLRRSQSAHVAQIQIGGLCLDVAGHIATLQGMALDLSARELAVLKVLMRSAGRVVSKEQLGVELPGLGDELSSNAIEVYVHRLRKKLEAGNINIRTVRGLGYLLEKP